MAEANANAAALERLEIETHRVLDEAQLVANIVFDELAAIKALVDKHGDDQLRRAVRRRLDALPERLRLATSGGATQH